MRILDLLVDDQEQLEEVFVGVNYRYEDGVLYPLKTRFRLTDIVMRLATLMENGQIACTAHREYPEWTGFAGSWFALTEAGHELWQREVSVTDALYE